MQCVENCDDPNPRHHVLYEQPIWQTLQMFRAPPITPVLFSSQLTLRRSRRNALYVSSNTYIRFRLCSAYHPLTCVHTPASSSSFVISLPHPQHTTHAVPTCPFSVFLTFPDTTLPRLPPCHPHMAQLQAPNCCRSVAPDGGRR